MTPIPLRERLKARRDQLQAIADRHERTRITTVDITHPRDMDTDLDR